jgi:3-deoxy-manno-octulosonate cytidylyltransferase (CMP-KDO synthetase)
LPSALCYLLYRFAVTCATVIIPARMGSTRFPGKVLACATGRPLVQHVWEAAKRARCASRVVVATDDDRVRAAVEGFGGECVLTGEHPNGTSRLAEAASKLGLGADAIVVNVQGDEPELEPAVIDEAVGAIERTGAPVATVAQPFGPDEDPTDANLVKVAVRADGTAMYFSRALIPYASEGGRGGRLPSQSRGEWHGPLKHVGLYVYRRAFLDRYRSLEPAEIERVEQLEQLRVLYHGFAIAVAVVRSRSFGGIDTPEQYESFVRRWRESHVS